MPTTFSKAGTEWFKTVTLEKVEETYKGQDKYIRDEAVKYWKKLNKDQKSKKESNPEKED